MPATSIFQRLPLHIAEAIAHYYVFPNSLNINFKHTDWKGAQPSWTTLYNVSYSWRMLAFQHFLGELTIRITPSDGRVKFVFLRLPKELKLNPKHYGHVKRVNIQSSASRVKQCKIPTKGFSAAWPENAVFPSARSLRIDLSILHYQEFDKHSISNKDEQFFWITERIQKSMPQLREVALDDQKLASAHYREFGDHQWKADRFLAAVFSKAKAFEINLRAVDLASDYLVGQSGTGLTNFKCALTGKCEIFGCIIDKSAATLESLFVRDFYFENVRSLIFNDVGTPIVYPRLQNFIFYGSSDSTSFEKICVDESIAPFPVLRYLRWSASYIFEDDTLFRENSDTLEDLNIGADVNLADVQQIHKIFSASKYLRLKQVSLSDVHYYSSTMLSPELFVGFAATLVAPAIRTVSLHYKFKSLNTISVLAAAPYSKNIQTLEITIQVVTLLELLELVKLFPNMTMLRCTPNTISDEDDNSQDSSYISDLYSRYCPLSNSLMYWTALGGYSQSIDTIAKAALMLSILCPNFVRVLDSSGHGVKFKRGVEQAIDSGMYDDHRDKLQRFLQNVR